MVCPNESGSAFLQRLRESLKQLGPAVLPVGLELPFVGGLIGYLSYDFARLLENIPNLALDDLQLPEARLGLYTWALISDHYVQTSQLIFHPNMADSDRMRLIDLFSHEKSNTPTTFKLHGLMDADITVENYQQAIMHILDYIQSGDCYQVNFAQRFRATCSGDPWVAYCALREACPTPFSGFQSLPDDGAVLSLSPERFVKISHRQVETRPIKGTRPRGRTPEEDSDYVTELLASTKDRAENLMIVDLLRNDLGRTCRTGSVKVMDLFRLESYPNVHHLVSSITGTLADDKDALDLVSGSFPGGSITGAPKIRAMHIINELEPTRRGLYCGSLVYLDVRGEMDSSIAIRSLLVKDGQVYCWGGGGIVADSQWKEEYQESLTKVQILLKTLESL